MQSLSLRRMLVPALVVCAVLSVPAAAGIPLPKEPEYTVTVIPYYAPEKIWARFAPFVEYLKEATGLPWELKLYHNHASLLDGLCGRDVSFALLDPVPLGRVIDRCDAGIVAVARGRDGAPFYHSVVLTSDPQVLSLEGLKGGKRFGFFKGSTAAHIFPFKMLRDSGVVPADVEPVFYVSQDRIVNALLKKEISAAGVKDALYRKFENEPLRVLATSEPLPGFAFASAPGVSEKTRHAFSEALLALEPDGNARDRKRMAGWDDEIKRGFIAVPAGYRASVLNVFSVYQEIAGADR